jgi:hypothetical protein
MMRRPPLGEVLATRMRATFPYRVNFDKIDYHNLAPMKEWCQTQCTGSWRFETIHALYLQFENEKDAMMFMLRWGNAAGNELK